jgi:hypothetical protein
VDGVNTTDPVVPEEVPATKEEDVLSKEDNPVDEYGWLN